jgi:alkyldihydroxyacetonephosphate synthase
MSANAMHLDEQSLLLEADGAVTIADVEDFLTTKGLTLGFDVNADLAAMSVTDWIARGSPGAKSHFVDPADHVLAGLVGTLGARTIDIRPGPRRAVGPDLVALFAGTGERLGRVTKAWIRAHRRDAQKPLMDVPRVDLDPPITEAESRLVDAIHAAMFTS